MSHELKRTELQLLGPCIIYNYFWFSLTIENLTSLRCRWQTRVTQCLIVSKRSDMYHTVLPANYTMPAFTS